MLSKSVASKILAFNLLPALLFAALLHFPPEPNLLTPEVAEAAELPVQVVSIDALIHDPAQKYGLNENHLYATLSRESAGFKDVDIQSQYPKSDGPNGKENSWGVCQINLDAFPDITRAEAQDPTFCIPWTAKQWVDGNAHLWSAYNQLKSKYGNGEWPV